MGGCEVRLVNQIDFEIFSNKLAMAGIELPENLIVHWTKEENKEWFKDYGESYSVDDWNSGRIKLDSIQTQNYKFKIQVD